MSHNTPKYVQKDDDGFFPDKDHYDTAQYGGLPLPRSTTHLTYLLDAAIQAEVCISTEPLALGLVRYHSLEAQSHLIAVPVRKPAVT